MWINLISLYYIDLSTHMLSNIVFSSYSSVKTNWALLFSLLFLFLSQNQNTIPLFFRSIYYSKSTTISPSLVQQMRRPVGWRRPTTALRPLQVCCSQHRQHGSELPPGSGHDPEPRIFSRYGQSLISRGLSCDDDWRRIRNFTVEKKKKKLNALL